VPLKSDLEKADDKVKWPFLQQVMSMKGFNPKWCSRTDHYASKCYIGHYFQTHKGLRQGDRLSPMLFNIISDMFAILISRAKEDGQVDGLILNLVEGGIYILQDAYDGTIFIEHNLGNFRYETHSMYVRGFVGTENQLP
jgi:hypothetical protein